jgi:zinc protease
MSGCMSIKRSCIVFILAVILSFPGNVNCLAMPKAVKMELSNHLKVLVFEEHSIPAVTMELLVSAGSRRDPQEMKGLANLTAKSVLLGTRSLSFDDINNRLDFIGASLDADCSRDFAMIGMQMLKKDLDSGTGLFADIIVHPSFPAADVDGQKDDIVGSLRAKEDDPIEVASRAFEQTLYVDTPYAGPVDGTEKSVSAIGTEDLAKFYASYYRPNDSVLVIGGDITPEEVQTLIVPRLIGWEAGEVPETPFRKEFAEGPKNVDINKPVSQATIIIGCLAMDRTSVDYYPFQVMNKILG